MWRIVLIGCLLLLQNIQLSSQVDFFGRPIQSNVFSNEANSFLFELNIGSVWTNDEGPLANFPGIASVMDAFQAGRNYGQPNNVDPFEYNTLVGGSHTRRIFTLAGGLRHPLWGFENESTFAIGSSHFPRRGMVMALAHSMRLLDVELGQDPAQQRSLFVSFYGGLRLGYDNGFRITLDESGVKDLIYDLLTEDLADGTINLEEFNRTKDVLFQSLEAVAPRDVGGTPFSFGPTFKLLAHARPWDEFNLRLFAGVEGFFDLITRPTERRQRYLKLAIGVNLGIAR
ncbi:MAG: hypothetical protein DA408_15890 [Bacteroidetes bacterium]|nr:MAG: hypothetical protein DA408_15890 [Bacteroidota bacterium]